MGKIEDLKNASEYLGIEVKNFTSRSLLIAALVGFSNDFASRIRVALTTDLKPQMPSLSPPPPVEHPSSQKPPRVVGKIKPQRCGVTRKSSVYSRP